MGLTAVVVFKQLAGMIADRSNQQYSIMMERMLAEVLASSFSHHVLERLLSY